MNFPSDLHPGDILLYSTKTIVDDLIEWKTSGTAAHVEIYAGSNSSWASRNGIGCGSGAYPYRNAGLCMVRRPVQSFNVSVASAFFNANLKNQPYGFVDILDEIGIERKGGGVDCSHAAALLLEAAGCPQFDLNYPKSLISPRDFQIVSTSDVIFRA